LSGVLGVVLTILFFFIGYRQTIGARKERASAANREISDTLLRRLILDPDFTLQYEEIERFIAGKALDNRVKMSDVIAMQEIYPLLYSRVVSSDYVPSKKRKGILEKLDKCFKPAPEDPHSIHSLQKEQAETVRAKITGEALLAGVSAVMAMAVSAALASSIIDWSAVNIQGIKLPIVMAGAAAALTAIVLVLYVQLKDKATATNSGVADALAATARGFEMETKFAERLGAIGIQFTKEREVDFVLYTKGRRIAIELKSRLVPTSMVKRYISHLHALLTKYGWDECYLVFASNVPSKYQSLGSEKVRILSLEDLFKILTAPEPVREATHE